MENQTVNHAEMKLGKKSVKHDERTLKLASFLIPSELPKQPSSEHYAKDIGINDWGMMGNDTIGDCTCAAAGHLIMEWTDDNEVKFTPTDEQIIEAYSAITGYNPKTGKNDNGAVELDVLNYWRKKGIAGHKIGAYVQVNPKLHTQFKQALYLLGDVYLGLALPITAQTQSTWKVVSQSGNGEPGSWGGHAVPVIGYDAQHVYVVTWGAVKKMSWSFLSTYCDEAYGILSADFLKADVAPNGFNLAQLQADLAEL